MVAKHKRASGKDARIKEKGSDPIDPLTEHHSHKHGAHVPLLAEHWYRNFRHWIAPKPNGTERTVAGKFLELEREGVAGQYDILYELAQEHYGPLSALFHRNIHDGGVKWEHMHTEDHDLAYSWAKGDGRELKHQGPPYGVVYEIARHQLNHSVSVPHVITPEEADRHNEQERAEARPGWPSCFIEAGDIEVRIDPTQGVKSQAEEVGQRWVELFVAEIKELLGNDSDPEHIAGFNVLRERLGTFEIGKMDGTPVLERLKREAKGRVVLDAFERCRARLLLGLDEIASVLPTSTVVVASNSVAVPIPWKGSVQVLAWLLRELAEKDWINAPRHSSTTTKYKAGDINASAFTKAMAPHFPVNATALGQELKAEGGTVPAQDVENFRVPQRPK